MPRGDGTGPYGGGGRGTGRGGRGGRGGTGGRGQGPCGKGAGPSGYCVCPKCGTRVPHRAGVSCVHTKCPKCGATMIREDT